MRFLEFALNQLIDNKLILSNFDKKFHNDETGAPAYDPRILLKIILFAYSRGITSSREIARCCEQNIVFMALSAHSCPHFTTIANFISSMDKEITTFFQEVLELIHLGFENWPIQKIEIHCADDNMKSRAIPERLGFQNEGTIRRTAKVNDSHQNHIIYGLLREEYFANQTLNYDSRNSPAVG